MSEEQYLLGWDKYPRTPENLADLTNLFNPMMKAKGGVDNQAYGQKVQDNENQSGGQKTANNSSNGARKRKQESTNFVNKGKETEQNKHESINEHTSKQLLSKKVELAINQSIKKMCR